MTANASTSGLRDALARLSANALSLVHTRLSLAGLELAEERDRIKSQLVMFAVGALAACFALLCATGFVVVHFWDTHREGAIIGLVLVYAAIAAWALYRATTIRRDAPPPFAATLAELEKDRERFLREHTL